jgi:hypothetical protein
MRAPAEGLLDLEHQIPFWGFSAESEFKHGRTFQDRWDTTYDANGQARAHGDGHLDQHLPWSSS